MYLVSKYFHLNTGASFVYILQERCGLAKDLLGEQANNQKT